MSLQGLFDRYEATLNGLARKSRLRKLSSRLGLDFASNDYLGLARSKRMAEAVGAALAAGAPIGATGSRLLRGNAPEHEALEAKA
ncbi:MAG: 8-amino-7-oxononanoate synthase, partial [Mesorhizobium sp.]